MMMIYNNNNNDNNYKKENWILIIQTMTHWPIITQTNSLADTNPNFRRFTLDL